MGTKEIQSYFFHMKWQKQFWIKNLLKGENNSVFSFNFIGTRNQKSENRQNPTKSEARILRYFLKMGTEMQ